MKNLIVSLVALAVFATGLNAQSNRQVDEAIRTIRGSKGKYNGPSLSSLSEGVLGQNGKLSLSTNSSGQVVISNATNAYTFTLNLPIPTANRTISWPIGGGTLVSTPTTLDWQFTGATYNTTLSATEPTVGNATITIPDLKDVDQAMMLSSLTTNAKDAANSIWFASNAMVFEGATADAFEITVSPADATADATWTIPNFAVNAAFFGSTLTTNNVDAANSVWAVSNGVRFEGATADTSEGTLAPADVTADQTWTLPDASGTVVVSAPEVVTSTNTIAASENGSVYFLNSSTEFVSTLPAPALGLHFTFIVTAAPSGASYTVVTNSSANIIKGNQNSVAGDAGDFGTADDTISFVDGQSVAGDKVEVWSDGTSWFAYAISKVAAGVTFTQAN